MNVFKDYSKYYNLLYKDKNYHAEVDYIIDLINLHKPSTKTILNLGCGTGNHDFILAQKGFAVTGIDLSEQMIEIANTKKTNEANLQFSQGDVRDLKLNETFDTVVSLFHVMSYQVTNQDLDNAIKTAYNHLQKDGIFIFDCWYGSGVLTDKPTIRTKQFDDENYKITRSSIPTMNANSNCVDVNFDVAIFDKKTQQQFALNEVHKMRYLFVPEIEYFLNNNGFDLVLSEEWMSRKELSYTSWNATFVCKKR